MLQTPHTDQHVGNASSVLGRSGRPSATCAPAVLDWMRPPIRKVYPSTNNGVIYTHAGPGRLQEISAAQLRNARLSRAGGEVGGVRQSTVTQYGTVTAGPLRPQKSAGTPHTPAACKRAISITRWMMRTQSMPTCPSPRKAARSVRRASGRRRAVATSERRRARSDSLTR